MSNVSKGKSGLPYLTNILLTVLLLGACSVLGESCIQQNRLPPVSTPDWMKDKERVACLSKLLQEPAEAAK